MMLYEAIICHNIVWELQRQEFQVHPGQQQHVSSNIRVSVENQIGKVQLEEQSRPAPDPNPTTLNIAMESRLQTYPRQQH